MTETDGPAFEQREKRAKVPEQNREQSRCRRMSRPSARPARSARRSFPCPHRSVPSARAVQDDFDPPVFLALLGCRVPVERIGFAAPFRRDPRPDRRAHRPAASARPRPAPRTGGNWTGTVRFGSAGYRCSRSPRSSPVSSFNAAPMRFSNGTKLGSIVALPEANIPRLLEPDDRVRRFADAPSPAPA